MTLAISLPLEAIVLWLGARASTPFAFGLIPLLIGVVPAVSLIAAAVGAPLRRKALYIGALLGATLVFYLLAYDTGWYVLAELRQPDSTSAAGLLSALYRLFPLAAPIVALMLFAGKQPSIFWSEA